MEVSLLIKDVNHMSVTETKDDLATLYKEEYVTKLN
jgi:hypothetical protein